MRRTTLLKTLLAGILVSAMGLGTAAFAHGGWGMGAGMMGPGMMGCYGPGGSESYGREYGMGPGMMGGAMMGPGMMTGGMMGPGMMGGGMMMGPGMMGPGMLSQLNLSPEQWSKVKGIHEELAKQQWELMGKIREESFKLGNLLAAEKRDRGAITSQYKTLQELRLQQLQTRLDGHEKLNTVLTTEQQAQLRRFAPWW